MTLTKIKESVSLALMAFPHQEVSAFDSETNLYVYFLYLTVNLNNPSNYCIYLILYNKHITNERERVILASTMNLY